MDGQGRRRIGWSLVGTQFVLLGVLTVPWPSRGDLPRGFAVAGGGLRVGGAAMAVLGSIHLGDALTPQPVPKSGAGLVGHGLYRFVRHPIYTGLLAYGIGSVLVNPHPATLAAGAGLLMLLMVKARWEESMLISAAPSYRQYAQHVGRFVPGVGRLPD